MYKQTTRTSVDSGMMDYSGSWEEDTANDSEPDSLSLSESNPFDMPWYFSLIFITLYAALLVVAVVGNFCIIFIIVKNLSMRTVTHYFILNLSVSDTLLATFNGLFMTIYLMESHWMFGETYCRIAQFLAPFLISTSIFTYAAMAADRYIAVVYPLRQKPTSMQVAVVLFGIWTVSAAIATPNFVFAVQLYADNGSRIVCAVKWPDGLHSASDKIYHFFLIILNYVVPLLVMTFAYSKICIVLWGSKLVGEWNRQQEECIKAKRKLVKMLIFCVAIFTICWAPMHTYQLATFISDAPRSWKYVNYLYVIIYLVAMSNTMYPPIIYCQLNARFRQGFQQILRRVCCCKEASQNDEDGGKRRSRYRANARAGESVGPTMASALIPSVLLRSQARRQSSPNLSISMMKGRDSPDDKRAKKTLIVSYSVNADKVYSSAQRRDLA